MWLWTHGGPVSFYPSPSCVFYSIIFLQFSLGILFQVKEDIAYLEAFDDAINAGFANHLPLHVSDPANSAFIVMTEAEFKERSVEDIQAIYRHKHILVTEMSTSTLKFDGKGLSSLTALSAVTDIQGASSFFLRSNWCFSHDSLRY